MRILIEGPDGAGKTTVSSALAEKLNCPRFVFPDRSTLSGKRIDAHLKELAMVTGDPRIDQYVARGRPKDSPPPLDGFTFQCLHFTNRLEKTPDLLESPTAVLDRYWPSGVVYGGVDGLDAAWLEHCGLALPVQPELFILLSVNIRTALERVKLSGKMSERYDDVSVLTRVIDGYSALWQRHARDSRPEWWVVDADGPLDDVIGQIERLIDSVEFRLANPVTVTVTDPEIYQLRLARDSAVAMSEERLREAIALRGENERLRTRNAELSKLTGDLEFERDELAKYKRRNPL